MRAMLVVGTLLLAGCLAFPVKPSAPGVTREAIGTPIIQKHDHEDVTQHVGAANVAYVNWSSLIPKELGTEGFAALRLVGDDSFIGTDGAHAGFLIVNVSDPAHPRLVSQYATPGGASQEAVPTDDGNWVFMNLQRQPAPGDVASDPARGDGLGIQIIDTHDKAHPRFESFYPVEVQGTHVMMYAKMEGKQYLVFNGQPAREGIPTGQVYTPPPGNVVHITEFTVVNGIHTLREVGQFRYDNALLAQTSQGCFPHDQWIEKHPITKKWVMYVAFWDCGAVTVDLSDPAKPTLLGVYDDPAPSKLNRIHFFRPDPTLRDGRVIAYSGPEIDQSQGEPGTLRAYDVTDPAKIKQIGTWRLPGSVENDQPFVFSMHNFDFDGNLLSLAHYHAGIWVLDVSHPENPSALGYYLPHGNDTKGYDGPKVWHKTPNFPISYFPNAYDAKWYTARDGKTYLLVSERGSGLYVLRYTGIVP